VGRAEILGELIDEAVASLPEELGIVRRGEQIFSVHVRVAVASVGFASTEGL